MSLRLTRKSSATAGGSECSKLTEFFHKSNVRIGTASGWLQRLVRYGGINLGILIDCMPFMLVTKRSQLLGRKRYHLLALAHRPLPQILLKAGFGENKDKTKRLLSGVLERDPDS